MGSNRNPNLEHVWKKVLAAKARGLLDDEDEGEQWIYAELQIRRKRHALIDDSIGLGAQLRWSIARDVLVEEERRRTGKPVKVAYYTPQLGQAIEFFQLGTVTSAQKGTRAGLHAKMAEDEKALETLVAKLNVAFGEIYLTRAGVSTITISDFLQPLFDVNAVRNFKSFLRTGQRAVCSHAGLVPALSSTSFCDEPESPANAEKLEALLHRLDKPHSGRPLEWLYAVESPSLLVSVAHEILRRKEGSADCRPVLLVPCSRHIRDKGHSGLDVLVHTLTCFFEQRPFTPTPPKMDPEEIATRVRAIREYLVKRPAILVFVGYEVERGRVKDLRRVIRDEPVAELLAQLVHAPVGPFELPYDVCEFERTRLIVLADGPIEILKAYSAPQVKFVCPSRNREATFHLSAVESTESASEIFQQLAMIESQAAAGQRSSFEELSRFGPEGVVARLHEALRTAASPLELLMLRFIAISAAGLQRTTLWRCAKAWSRAVCGKEVPPHLLPELPADEEAECAFRSFLDRYSTIVSEGAAEPMAELDPMWHPYEYPDYRDWACADSPVHLGTSHPTSLEIRHAAVKNALVNGCDKDEPPWVFLLLQEVMATEALRQHAVLLRHLPHIERASMRTLRRALETLLYGFLSLPSADCIEQYNAWPRCTATGLLPRDPVDRFRFLYVELFREHLEAAPTHRLSLQWAADLVKLDILTLAHQAFSAEPCSFAKVPAWATRTQLSNGLSQLLEYHYAAVAVAAQRAGDAQRFDAISEGATEAATSLPAAMGSTRAHLHKLRFDFQVAHRGAQDPEFYRTVCAEISRICEDAMDLHAGPWIKKETDANGRSRHVMVVPSPYELKRHFDYFVAVASSSPKSQRRDLANWLQRLADLRYQCTDHDSAKTINRWSLSFEALTAAHVAESLRNSGHAADPLGSAPHLSFKGARVAARAGLEIIRILNTPIDAQRRRSTELSAASQVDALSRFIAALTRTRLDAYALQGEQYLPEMVSQLIIEARYARTVGALVKNSDERRYRVALRFLRQAERIQGTYRPRSRQLIRLYIERCATLRGISVYLRARELPWGERYASLAHMDVMQMGHIVRAEFGAREDDMGAATWQAAIEHQRRLTVDEISNYPSLAERLGVSA